MSANIDASLARIFANGRPQVGLEVGTDAGLAADEHIRITQSMRREVWYFVGDEAPAFNGFRVENPGWTLFNPATTELLHHKGTWYEVTNGVTNEIAAFQVEPQSVDTIRAFVAVNVAAINRVQATHTNYVHACRFWTAASGFADSNSSSEYLEVENPDQAATAAVPDATVVFIARYSRQVFTAITARAASWRKSNHATGGPIAHGDPLRWMQKNNFFTVAAQTGGAGGPAALTAAQSADTTDFYIATHAAGVHPALALMAPDDDNHFCFVRPRWGLVEQFDIKNSMRIRISDPLQVAGVAMVADAYVVLQALVSEATSGLLQSRGQVAALHAARETIKANGIRVASYSSWFLERHPNGVAPVPFNQKALEYSDLVGELAACAVWYFRGTTISASQALANADAQLCTTSARDLWIELGRNKSNATTLLSLLPAPGPSGHSNHSDRDPTR